MIKIFIKWAILLVALSTLVFAVFYVVQKKQTRNQTQAKESICDVPAPCEPEEEKTVRLSWIKADSLLVTITFSKNYHETTEKKYLLDVNLNKFSPFTLPEEKGVDRFLYSLPSPYSNETLFVYADKNITFGEWVTVGKKLFFIGDDKKLGRVCNSYLWLSDDKILHYQLSNGDVLYNGEYQDIESKACREYSVAIDDWKPIDCLKGLKGPGGSPLYSNISKNLILESQYSEGVSWYFIYRLGKNGLQETNFPELEFNSGSEEEGGVEFIGADLEENKVYFLSTCYLELGISQDTCLYHPPFESLRLYSWSFKNKKLDLIETGIPKEVFISPNGHFLSYILENKKICTAKIDSLDNFKIPKTINQDTCLDLPSTK